LKNGNETGVFAKGYGYTTYGDQGLNTNALDTTLNQYEATTGWIDIIGGDGKPYSIFIKNGLIIGYINGIVENDSSIGNVIENKPCHDIIAPYLHSANRGWNINVSLSHFSNYTKIKYLGKDLEDRIGKLET
jgi:hypothetical protein